MINLKPKFKSPHCDQIISIYQSKVNVPQYKGNLYLGGVRSIQRPTLYQHKINSVLTIIDKWTYQYYDLDSKVSKFNLLPNHKWINLDDVQHQSIYPYFSDSNEFLRNKLSDQNVLVHCHMGISRSASLVLAFLMSQFKMNLNDAYLHTVGKRDCIEPNATFWKQLQKYEQQLKKNDPKFGTYKNPNEYQAKQQKKEKTQDKQK